MTKSIDLKEMQIETTYPWEVTSVTWWNKISLMFPSTTITEHPSTDKSACWGAVGSSTIRWGTWEEPCPPCQVTDIQTSDLAADPVVACELPSAPRGLGPGAPGKHCFRQWSMDERVLVDVQISEEKFQHIIGRKKEKVWLHWRGQEEQLGLTYTIPLLRQYSMRSGEVSACEFSHGGKWEPVHGHLASPDAEDAHFSLTPSRVLNCELHEWGVGRNRESSGRDSKGMEDPQNLLAALWTPPRSLPARCWERLACRPPQLAHSTPQCSVCLTHTHLILWLVPCVCLQWQWQEQDLADK